MCNLLQLKNLGCFSYFFFFFKDGLRLETAGVWLNIILWGTHFFWGGGGGAFV